MHAAVRPDAFERPVARLVGHGALDAARVAGGEWWRVVTGALLHHDVAHLLGNAVGLLVLGTTLAAASSPGRFAVVAAAGAVGGNVAQVILGPPDAVTVGASGAVLALLGALVTYRLRALRFDRRALRGREHLRLVGLAALALLGVGRPGHTAWLAHAGGFLVGLTLAPWPARPPLQLVVGAGPPQPGGAAPDERDRLRWN